MAEGNYSALVVDDEDLVRALTVRALERYGFTCTQASDGVEAARLIVSKHYDVLVTDLRMPNGNGHSLAMAQLSMAPRPLVVVLTGVLEPRLGQHLLRRGIDDIMFKPVDYEMFASKVVVLLERHLEQRVLPPAFPAGWPGTTPAQVDNSVQANIEEQCERQRSEPTPEPQEPVPESRLDQDSQENITATSPTISRDSAFALAEPGLVRQTAQLARALTLAKIGTLAAVVLLLASVWIWMQLLVLRQAKLALRSLEEAGARVSVSAHGDARVSFAPGRRPQRLEALAHVPNLRRIDLADAVITDDDLVSLKNLQDLQDLDLQGTGISDAGLERLNGLKSLRRLSLRGTRVTDAGLQHLRQLLNLQELSLIDTQVSGEAADELRRAIPFVNVTRYDGSRAGK